MKIWSNIRKKKRLVINVFINKGTDGEEYESWKKIIQHGLVNNTAQMIQVGLIDDIDTDDIHPRGYYMVEFTSSTYKLQ